MIKDTIPGVVGNCTSGVAFSVAWMTANAMPVLHALSVLIGIGASAATAVYYLRLARKVKTKKGRRRK